MKATQQLRELGQSLWLDTITRGLLDNGTLQHYISELDVAGLTSNPTIFDKAIQNSNDYDDDIRARARAGESGETLFFGLALEDLTRAADLFRPIHATSGGLDGWASMELPPTLADDTARSVKAAIRLYAQADRTNLFIKIPGTRAGVVAVEEAIFAGVPINVTLLFSREHYLAAAEAYLRGIERRLAAGRDPRVASVASLFVSRWDAAVQEQVPAALRNRLGIAVATHTYNAYRNLLASARWQNLARAGALPQRLLWGSTGTKDPTASETLYLEALAAPDTINTMPEKTLLAFADHGKVSSALPADGGDAEAVLAEFNQTGIDTGELAAQLQRDGVNAFARSWGDLLDRISAKTDQLSGTGQI